LSVRPDERGSGVGAALVAGLHRALEAAGVAVTPLHHGQVNPLSAPFWSRMGYRPLWTNWEIRPARALRRPGLVESGSVIALSGTGGGWLG
jgi:predicted N-acetyltransferase YhbS